ncbi:MAG: hypothetical protein V4598_07980 [Bdellovibrionota bacterium]
MKMLILALILISPLAMALPVLNENAVTNGSLVTLWPDHEDKNVFYYAPSMYETLAFEDGPSVTAFSESEILGVHKAIYSTDLDKAVTHLLSQNPDAIVKPVRLDSPRIVESRALSEFIEDQFCTIIPDHGNGGCILYVREGKFQRLKTIIENTGIMLSVEYKVEGVLRLVSGTIEHTGTYGIPLLIKGSVNLLTDL